MNKDLFKFPIRHLIQMKINSGTLLIIVAVLAMIAANSPFAEAYNSFLNMPVNLSFGSFSIFEHNGHIMTLQEVINDALMAIFFFSVGLEIKREVLVGELSSLRKALLPIVAACGGMIVPVFVFLITVPSEPALASNGCAIPMATDIAFSLSVLSMLGSRVPLSLKIFLTTLAVADDIGGIIVIALFYGGSIDPTFLLYVAIVLIIMYLCGRMGLTSKAFYIVGFCVAWYCMLHSGIHATIAGVLAAFTIPACPKLNLGSFVQDIRESLNSLPMHKDAKIHLSNSEISVLKHIEDSSDKTVSTLQALDDGVAPLVNFFIMPLFAFANANITFDNVSVEQLEGLSMTVALALFVGKFLGIFSFTYICVKTKLLAMPDKITTKALAGVSILGGIGFTVSLFIADLSYRGHGVEGAELLNEAKLGIVAGSLLSGFVGYFILNKILGKSEK